MSRHYGFVGGWGLSPGTRLNLLVGRATFFRNNIEKKTVRTLCITRIQTTKTVRLGFAPENRRYRAELVRLRNSYLLTSSNIRVYQLKTTSFKRVRRLKTCIYYLRCVFSRWRVSKRSCRPLSTIERHIKSHKAIRTVYGSLVSDLDGRSYGHPSNML